jgi:hypothetical protein
MLTAFALCVCVGAQPELNPGEYRVEFEVVLAPPKSDTAVYRARIWTVDRQDVHLSIGANQIGIEGGTRPEPGGKLFRADAVIVVSVRKDGDKRQLESVFNCGGEVRLTDDLPAGAELANVLGLRKPGTLTQKLGEDVPLGKLYGKTITVSARAPRR